MAQLASATHGAVMDVSRDLDDYSPEKLLHRVAAENAELRVLLYAVAGDLERLACEHPLLASRLLARRARAVDLFLCL
jgi:hypothetical protein